MQPYSHIAPQTDKAEDIQTLYKITFWAALIVFIGVQAAILYTALRFRRRNEDRPEQVHGSRKLEIAWTVIPAVILLVLFIPNAQVIFKHAAAEQGPDKFDVDVIGKQWWWEFRYRDIPADPDNPDAGPLVTANEALLPVGADVVFHVTSNNVIHSFWVPQLSGKVDVVPGHDNPLQFVASTPGDYFGECAEFCGAAHAWMRFKVKIVPEENFDAWVTAWRTPPDVRRQCRRPPTSWRRLPPSAPVSPATTSPAPTRALPRKGWRSTPAISTNKQARSSADPGRI